MRNGPPVSWHSLRSPLPKPPSPDRVFNQPNHPRYGAARRLWVVLATLCPDFERLDDAFLSVWGSVWDERMVQYLDAEVAEDQAARSVVLLAIGAYENHE